MFGWENVYVLGHRDHGFKRTTKKFILDKLSRYDALSLDTETQGDFNHIHLQKVVMLQIGTTDFQIIVDTRLFDPTEILLSIKDKLLIGHNIKYDYEVIKLNYGIELGNVYDTLLACQIRENGVKAKPGHFTLDSCVQRYVDKFAYSRQMYIGEPYVTKKVRESFSKTEGDFTDEQILYGAKDIFYAYALYKYLGRNETSNFEERFLPAAAQMELCGMPINERRWEEIYLENVVVRDRLRADLDLLYQINWNSPAQIKPILKAKGFDLSIIDKDTGEIKDTINAQIIEKYKQDPLIGKYLEYKKADKLCSMYGLKFLRHVSPVTGRVHTSIFQLKDTGRTSSSGPNMQNIKRDGPFRAAFECPEGYTFVSADYSNQELRVLAELANEETMIEAFNTGQDFHLNTAKLAFDNEELTADSPERSLGKTINFLIPYGGGAKKLSTGTGVSLAKAKELVTNLMSAYKNLPPYFEYWGNEFRETGSLTISDFTGRTFKPYYYDEYLFCSKNKDRHPSIQNRYSYLYAKLQRRAQNYRIQGLSAEMSKLACIYLLEWKSICDLALMIHDEIIVICKKENADLVGVILKDCMERAFNYYCKKVTITIKVSASTVWKK